MAENIAIPVKAITDTVMDATLLLANLLIATAILLLAHLDQRLCRMPHGPR